MLTRRFGLALAILLTSAGCRDVVAPVAERGGPAPQFETVAGPDSDDVADYSDVGQDSTAPVRTRILQQSATAPQLETYRVSFWLSRTKATQIIVRYRPAAGESVGQPFLLFDVPKDALRTGGGGARLAKRDSVLITMTIDPSAFLVDFQPSGVLFSQKKPGTLVFWYQQADQDLNRDGVVNGVDRAWEQQLRIIYRRNDHAHWHKTKSLKGWNAPYVFAPLRHFSSYAVSW